MNSRKTLPVVLGSALAAALALGGPGLRRAEAHVSVASGVGLANTTQELTFGVGHGCAGADTTRVRIEIPAGVGSVRPENSGFGRTSVEKDDTGVVTAVAWQKADADVLPADTEYYKLTVRLKLPDQPFSMLFFPAHQTCRGADGTVSVVDWTALPGSTAAGDGGAADEPAPALAVVPAHRPGWNRFTVDRALGASDLPVYFGDALIVWQGKAAFSVNAATTELIKGTSGVTALANLSPGDVVWVRY